MQDITVQNIHKGLNDKGYICDVPFASRVSSALKTKPVGGAFLYGPAGTGKSYLPIVLSNIMEIDMFFFQCSPGTREDDLVLKMFPSENTKSGVEIKKSTVLQAAECSHNKKVMLVLDEWDKTRPTADGFFLDFLQYGRLSIPGSDINANLDNMTIFFTANDEREFHEALLRRFPKIDINPLNPSLVMSALRLTHDGHPQLGSVIKLYEKAVMSGMPKPATIQEIRQLLDAITFLGNGSDWNQLVYQYITKTPENHKMLKDAEHMDYEEEDSVVKLSNDNYDSDDSIYTAEKPQIRYRMPKSVQVHTDSNPINDEHNMPEDRDIYAVFDYNDETYSQISHNANSRRKESKDVSVVDDFEVTHGNLIRRQPFPMTDMPQYGNLDIKNGELCFVDESMSFDDIQLMPGWGDWEIRRYSENEIVARLVHNERLYDMRWTKDSGITLIVSGKELQGFHNIFQNSRVLTEYARSNLVIEPALLLRRAFDVGILNARKLIKFNSTNTYEFLNENLNTNLRHLRGFPSLSECSKLIPGTHRSIYEGRGFRVKSFMSNGRSNAVIRIEITGTPTDTALYALCEIGTNDFGSNLMNIIPVYKVVKCNPKKAFQSLQRYGWKPASSRNKIVKEYKWFGRKYRCDILSLGDSVMIVGRFEYMESAPNVRVFSRMRDTVNKIAKSVEKHG